MRTIGLCRHTGESASTRRRIDELKKFCETNTREDYELLIEPTFGDPTWENSVQEALRIAATFSVSNFVASSVFDLANSTETLVTNLAKLARISGDIVFLQEGLSRSSGGLNFLDPSLLNLLSLDQSMRSARMKHGHFQRLHSGARNKRRRLAESTEFDIVALLNEGALPLRAIAEQTGVSLRTVQRVRDRQFDLAADVVGTPPLETQLKAMRALTEPTQDKSKFRSQAVVQHGGRRALELDDPRTSDNQILDDPHHLPRALDLGDD